ncbi:MAG: Ig-like domain-containing protein [Proteobacteria bacterium]|nr:Ig-like domain-containing protein [Pseudomonadota bacterium]
MQKYTKNDFEWIDMARPFCFFSYLIINIFLMVSCESKLSVVLNGKSKSAGALTSPSLVLSSSSGSVTKSNSVSISAIFSETVTGFEKDDIGIVNGVVSQFAGSGDKYSFVVSPSTQGDVSIEVGVAAAKNSKGKVLSSAATLKFKYDSVVPTLSFSSISPASPSVSLNTTPTVSLNLSENAKVTLYSNATCTTVASSSTSLVGSSGQTIVTSELPRPSSTTLYGRAVDDAGNVSECTKLVNYTLLIKLEDPNPSIGNGFGTHVVELTGRNIVVTSPYADVQGVTDAGAVYLFNGTTGELISSLYGSTLSDKIGEQYVTALTNGNFVVRSAYWDCQASLGCSGTIVNVGAVTWGSGVTGVSGFVSTTNSLVGSTGNDYLGMAIVTPLTNGNYTVSSGVWDCSVARGCSGSIVDAGAVTWGSGTSGISGFVSTTNSLVGSTASDGIGSSLVTALSNGNYVVKSPYWDCQASLGCSGTITDVGAATWGSGTSGISGFVSTTNSLVGSTASDQVGSQVTALTNGNYVVATTSWTCLAIRGCSGTVGAVGAATWGSGTTGISGFVSVANSLVGSSTSDVVGGGIYALTNGNYVIVSSNWDCLAIRGCSGTVVNVGAATWGSGTSGISGFVSATNSLVGSSFGDSVGSLGVTALTNGNYVVNSFNWDCQSTSGCSGAVVNAGAATWASGTSGITGFVSATNSLVGATDNDQIGGSGVVALTNGNFVVSSYTWDCQSGTGCVSGTVVDAGAVTWGSGTTGLSGFVSSTNSLIGSSANDGVGLWITRLSNGNFVVVSTSWDCKSTLGCTGTIANVGAVTWVSGATGISGFVSATNSLVGSATGDVVGNGTVFALSNGGYLVGSPSWDCSVSQGCVADAVDVGAVTWGSGTAGIVGQVSASNSLVGSSSSGTVGLGPIFMTLVATPLSNGNYVVGSQYWDCQESLGCSSTATNVGAITWGSGDTGVVGVVSTNNSLVGSTAEDSLGVRYTLTALSNGNFVSKVTQFGSSDLPFLFIGSGSSGGAGVL